MGNINPVVLQWARKESALSIQEAANKLGFKDSKFATASDKLDAIEKGKVEVSKSQLEKMSQVYRKSLLTLYSTDIPKRKNIATDFRKKSAKITPREDAWLNTLLLDYSVRQSILVDAITEDEDLPPLVYVGSVGENTAIEEIKNLLLRVTRFNLEKFRGFRTVEDAFNYSRKCFENAGVFVILVGNLGSHHTGLSTEVFRGFSLVDNFAPLIVINSNDAKGALAFTLFHEIVHILLGQSSVSNGNDLLDIEKLCDQVASEVLFYPGELKNLQIYEKSFFDETVDKIEKFVNVSKLSYTAVALNLYKQGFIGYEYFEKLESYYRKKYQASIEEKRRRKEDGGGPSYKVIKTYQNGKWLTGMVTDLLRDGSMTYRDASRVLGTKQTTLYSLIKN